MNQQRTKIYEELKSKHLKQTAGVPSAAMIQSQSASPFILSSGPVTGLNTSAPILPNQVNSSTFSSLEAMSPAQKAVVNAHRTTFGFYVPQETILNPILPVLPRYI